MRQFTWTQSLWRCRYQHFHLLWTAGPPDLASWIWIDFLIKLKMHCDRYCLPENFQIWGKLVWQSDSAVRINGNIFIKQVGAGTRINAARGLFTLVVTKNLQEKPPSWKWIIVKIAQYLLPWLRQAVWTTTWENIVCLNKMQFPLQNQRFARDNMSNYTHGKYLRNIQIWILPCASRGRLARKKVYLYDNEFL